jgi:hypothetical protein
MKTRIFALSLALCAGCFSVEVAESPVLGRSSAGHVVVSNYGWTLFGYVPVVCGNANAESWCPFTFFWNDLKPEFAKARLDAAAAERNAIATDVWYYGTNDVLFDFYYTPLPWVIVYKEVNLSANLVKKEGDR